MAFSTEQQAYVTAHPIEVALTMPLTWDTADEFLPTEQVQNFLNAWISSRDASIKEQAEVKCKRDPAFIFKGLKAQELALAYVKEKRLAKEGFEPAFQSMGKGLILWSIEQGEGTIDAAMAVMKDYGLSMEGCTNEFGARAMWDLQAREQVDDFVISLYGDDRGWGEGAYYLIITYNNAEVDRLFKLDGCGV